MDREYSFCEKYFIEGEHELWHGQSNGANEDHKTLLFSFGMISIIFGVIFAIVSCFISAVMALFGIPFVLVGAYLAFGHARVISSTRYVVTSRKIYRSQLGRVDSLDISELPQYRIIVHNGGRGTIHFDEGDGGYKKRIGKRSIHSIDNIDNIAELDKIIKNAVRNF